MFFFSSLSLGGALKEKEMTIYQAFREGYLALSATADMTKRQMQLLQKEYYMALSCRLPFT